MELYVYFNTKCFDCGTEDRVVLAETCRSVK